MKVRRSRSLLALAAGTLVLAGCGSTAPPAPELAEEMIDTLDVSDDVKACMKEELANFELTEEEAKGFTDLDDVATKADEGQALALDVMQRLEDQLASCNAPG